MTAPITGTARIDLTALTDQLRVLPTSRSWVAVQDSINMLQARTPEQRMQPEMQDHVDNVAVFANTIRDHADVIAHALACGMALARLAQGSNPSSNVPGALQTLSTAYNFKDLSTELVKERLVATWTVLRRLARGGSAHAAPPGSPPTHGAPVAATPSEKSIDIEPLSTASMPSVQGKADVVPYFGWLETVLQAARATSPATPALLESIQLEAWSSVLARYTAELRSAGVPVPDISEAICGQALLPPSSVLGFSVRDTPAVAWSKFVVPDGSLPASQPVAFPWWAHGLAAHALGFRSADRVKMLTLFSFLDSLPWNVGRTGRVANQQEHEEFLERSRQFLQHGLPHTLFVVRRETDSMVATWPTCPTAAVLPMTVAQATTLLDVTRQQGLSALNVLAVSPRVEWTVAVEYPMDNQAGGVATTLLSVLRDLFRVTSPPARVQSVLFGPGARETARSADIAVASPGRYEDLIPSGIKSAS